MSNKEKHICGDCIHDDACEWAVSNENMFICCSFIDKKVLERPQGKWIPVSERLPDKEGEYLVTRADFDSWGICRLSNIIDIAKFDYSYHYNNGFHKAYEVIAWMPLPEPYKESKND